MSRIDDGLHKIWKRKSISEKTGVPIGKIIASIMK